MIMQVFDRTASTTTRRWRTANGTALLLVVATIAIGALSSPAHASSPCMRMGPDRSRVVISVGGGQTVDIARDTAGNFNLTGDGILHPTCGGATVRNINTV